MSKVQSSSSFFNSKLGEITVWLGSECNLRCKYCFVYKLNGELPTGKMTLQTADQLINFAKQNLRPNGTIWFFGAEPFCNFDTMKYIVEKSIAEGNKWKFGATTNATLLTEERVRWMKQYNFSLLCSIDGPKESHNKNRIYSNGEGSWDDAWRGLNNIRKILNRTPQVRWTVTPSTVKGLAENVRLFVEEYKITSMPIDFAHEMTWTQEDLANLKAELEIFREHYRKWMQQGIPVFNMWIRDANTAVSNDHRRIWASRCGIGTGHVGVDYDGSIYPCHRFIGSHEVKIGNIFTGFDPKQMEWVEKWRKAAPYCEIPQKCLKCNFKKACIGGCIAMNYDLFGNPHVNPVTACTIKQLITEVLGDLCKSLQGNTTFQKVYRRSNQNQSPASIQKKSDACNGKPDNTKAHEVKENAKEKAKTDSTQPTEKENTQANDPKIDG